MSKISTFPEGTNLRLLFENCDCGDEALHSHESTTLSIARAIETVGFHHLSNTGHTFSEGGYTSAFILAESHVVVHTWPEHERSVIVEISVCDFKRKNRERTLDLGKEIALIYQPQKTFQEILPMVPSIANRVLPGQGCFVELDELVESRSSAYQSVLIAETKAYGRVLVLDGTFQSSEKDGFFYHEPLVHVPLLSHDAPKDVLICGGGDGAAAYEALKHSTVEKCTVVEIDRVVAELSKKELYGVHKGALDDPRVTLHIDDASVFVRETDRKFDVVLVDITDPGGISETLYTQPFFESVRSVLREDGCFALHLGAPLQGNPLRDRAIKQLRELYPSVYPYVNYVPCYGTLLAFFICFQKQNSVPTSDVAARRLNERGIADLNLITPETFPALFALPPVLRSALSETDEE